MKYSVVIPTYNHCNDLLKPCIESLLKYSIVSDIELIVSANGCTDNTFEYLGALKEKYVYLGLEQNLKIVWCPEPLGYSRACNLGIQQATTDYIVLLNNDVLFMEQYKNRWLDLFENQFKTNTKCGISCVIKGPSAPAGHDFAVFFIVMIHRKVFDKIGLLNTEYGVGGGEDTEFCIEAERAGFEVCEAVEKRWGGEMYVGDFPVYHKGEGTMHDPTLVPEWNRIFHENSIRLAKKYNLDWYKWAISNNSERGVFFKGDQVFPREKFRYEFAAQNLIGTKVLEIGCSSGFGLQFLPDNIDYTGIDYDKEIIEAANMQQWRTDAKFLQADIHQYTLDQYDTIIAFETIEHIQNGLQLIERLKKHCKKLIISVPYNENPGQFSLHHLVHNLTPEKFIGFQTHGLIDINGNLLNDFNVNNNVEYNLLVSWTNENTDFRDRLKFLDIQYPEVYKELVTDNIYNIKKEQVEGKCVIDVGANIGIYSLLVAELGAKKVLAIEPISDTFNQLCKNINIGNYRNIIPMKNVVSEKSNSTVNISVKQESGHNSMYNITEKYETVHTLTLSELVKQCEDDDIVLKLDCEGAEYDILLNVTNEDMSRIGRIMLEIHGDLHPVYKGHEILNDRLTSFGFIIEDVKQIYTWDINEHGERVNWKMIPYRVEIWKR